MPTLFAQDDAAAGLKVLDRLIGSWNSEMTSKPAKWFPEGGRATVSENASWILKKRFVISRDVVRAEGKKSMWLITYDPQKKSYPMWFFDNKGLYGGEWSGTWEEATKTITAKATDTPPGWTSQATIQFPDERSIVSTAWMKDENGALLLDLEGKKTRQSDAEGEKSLADWSVRVKTDNLPPELKILEPLVGVWNVVGVAKPAEWTPKEERTTSIVTRKWILDGHFLQDSSVVSDGSEGINFFTYDPQRKAYFSWWFGSQGYTSKSTGEWNEAASSLSMKSELDGGLTSTGGVQLTDKDQHEWKIITTDGTGKKYFDATWNCRRKE